MAAGAGNVLASLILYFSGVYGQTKMVCTLKGSSVDLSCSVKNPFPSNKWYTVHSEGFAFFQGKLPEDGRHVTYASEDGATLTISNLTESDTSFYCCVENPRVCWENAIQLSVTDLQVTVYPATVGPTVILRCSSSCRLTKRPAAYIWYRNGEILYEDSSPWYQEMVRSDNAVAYSCAVKGYDNLRAPEVSVDSVTSTCFNVTYANGRMCSSNLKSEDEPCSFTYPREIRVEQTPMSQLGHVTLNCVTSCTMAEPETVYTWNRNRCRYLESHNLLFRNSTNSSFSCAVRGLEHLPSAEVCVSDKNCWTVNYASRRICALEGSLVNIFRENSYKQPDNQQSTSPQWYKRQSGSEDRAKIQRIRVGGRVEYRGNTNQHILRISNVRRTDSGEYTFRLKGDEDQCKWPGVKLTVTGLKVRLHPEVATEGDRVTLTCITSCPLSENTNYIWYLNGRPLTLTESPSKRLVLDPVSSQHAGNYSCVVGKGKRNISSTEQTLTVVTFTTIHTTAAATGAGAVLLVIVALTVFWWIHRKKASSQPPKPEGSPSRDQLNSSPLYENIPAQHSEQDNHPYIRLNFSKDHTEELYSTIEPASSK